jgi:hypothetical protein
MNYINLYSLLKQALKMDFVKEEGKDFLFRQLEVNQEGIVLVLQCSRSPDPESVRDGIRLRI